MAAERSDSYPKNEFFTGIFKITGIRDEKGENSCVDLVKKHSKKERNLKAVKSNLSCQKSPGDNLKTLINFICFLCLKLVFGHISCNLGALQSLF